MYVVPFVLEEAIAAGLSIWSFCESQGKESPEPEKVSTIEETSMKKCADQALFSWEKLAERFGL